MIHIFYDYGAFFGGLANVCVNSGDSKYLLLLSRHCEP